jgi:hypothetical protein
MSHRGRIVVILVLCLAFVAVPVAAHAAVEPPPGGPILVVTSSADPFTSYYTEILRAEGLNEFSTADVSALSAETLSAYSVVVLGARGPSGGQASLLSNWVQAGGNLIAMRPDATLAGVLGIAPTGGHPEQRRPARRHCPAARGGHHRTSERGDSYRAADRPPVVDL